MQEKDYSFTGSKGVNIYARANVVENYKGNIVIVHGICEHLERYDYITKAFNENKFNVFRYDARGHGRSEGARGDLESFDDYLDDLDLLISKVKKEYPGKLVLLGHSMGGLVATSYAGKWNNEKIDYLAVSGGANCTPKDAKPLHIIPMWLCKKLVYKNELGDGVCGDKEVVEKYNTDPLVLKTTSFRLMKNAFIYGCKFSHDHIENITVPAIIMHGEKDGIVVKETGEWTYNNIKSEDKTLKIYSDTYHEIFNDLKKDEVIKDLTDWLNSHIGE